MGLTTIFTGRRKADIYNLEKYIMVKVKKRLCLFFSSVAIIGNFLVADATGDDEKNQDIKSEQNIKPSHGLKTGEKFSLETPSINVELKTGDERKLILEFGQGIRSFHLDSSFYQTDGDLEEECVKYNATLNEYCIQLHHLLDQSEHPDSPLTPTGILSFSITKNGSVIVNSARAISCRFKIPGTLYIRRNSKLPKGGFLDPIEISRMNVNASVFENRANPSITNLDFQGKVFSNKGKIAGLRIHVDAEDFRNRQGVVSFAQEVDISAQHAVDNEQGAIQSLRQVILCTRELNNMGGAIRGEESTFLSKIRVLEGKGGEIGGLSKTALSFKDCPIIEDAGKIQGLILDLSDGSDSQENTISSLEIKSGILVGDHLIKLNGTYFKLPNVTLQAPRLETTAQDFLLNVVRGCRETIVRIHPTRGFHLTNPYRTEGTLEFWEDGVDSKGGLAREMDKLREITDTASKKPQYDVQLDETIQADDGLNFYTPHAKVSLGNVSSEKVPEFILQNTSMSVFSSVYDQVKAIVAAQNSIIDAPFGIHIGRLMRDPSRLTFITFFSYRGCAGSHNLGGDLGDVAYGFLGNTLKDVYDGHCLARLPYAIGNGSALIVKNLADLRGRVVNQGEIRSKNIHLTSKDESECVAGLIRAENSFVLNGPGGLALKRSMGDLSMNYHTYGGRRIRHARSTSSLVSSGPAQLWVGGQVSTSEGGDKRPGIRNIGSLLYAKSKAANLPIATEDATSSLHQKTYTMDEVNEKKLLERGYSGPRCPITRPTNSYADNGCAGTGVNFLYKTNNFEGCEKVFPPQTSIGGDVIFSTDRFSGHVSSPRMLLRLDDRLEITIGSLNNYHIEPKDSLRSLMEGEFNGFTIRIDAGIKEALDQASSKRFFFRLTPKYFFDELLAEEFYRRIHGAVYIYEKSGVQQAMPPFIFTYSPTMLLELVQRECQHVLMRGYFRSGEIIDLELLERLHLNTKEYVTSEIHDSLESQVSTAMATFATPSAIAGPKDPMIFYRPITGQDGLRELAPYLFIPQEMIKQVRDQGVRITRGSINADFLAAFPSHYRAFDMVNSMRDMPEQLAILMDFILRNAGQLRALERN